MLFSTSCTQMYTCSGILHIALWPNEKEVQSGLDADKASPEDK